MPVSNDHKHWTAHDLTEYGCMLCDTGQFSEALSYFDLAISKNQGFKDAWYSKGGAFISLEEFHKAVICYERVLQIDPGDVDAKIYLRDLKKHINDHGLRTSGTVKVDEFLAELAAMQIPDKDRFRRIVKRTQYYSEVNMPIQLIHLLSEAIRYSSQSGLTGLVYINRAFAHLGNHDISDARADYSRAIELCELSQDRAVCYYNRALTWTGISDAEQKADLENAMLVDPTHSRAIDAMSNFKNSIYPLGKIIPPPLIRC